MKALRTETIEGREVLIVETSICPVCGKTRTHNLNPEHFKRWRDGEHIQNVMPYLTNAERESLISGVCSDECWSVLWEGTELE
jgi:hypothetical protein